MAGVIFSVFMKMVRGNPGLPPRFESAGWYHGLHKLIKCADEQLVTLHKDVVSLLGEMWKLAKLKAVDLRLFGSEEPNRETLANRASPDTAQCRVPQHSQGIQP